MLLRHKPIQDRDQNWCTILSPLKNEIDKTKVAHKIAEVFVLSVEEAQDLVANTPIILLDNLDRPTALKVKEYFGRLGAEMTFTNDIFQKRRCYRTIWPEPPDLSFLGAWPELSAQKETSGQELLAPEEALNEIRSFVRDDSKPSQTQAVFQPVPASDQAKLLEEIEYWKEQYGVLREQVRLLKEEMNQSFASTVQKEDSLTLKGELTEVQGLLASTQESHRILQEEYRMACELYEDKCSVLAKESENLKKANQELFEKIQRLEKEKHDLGNVLVQKDGQYKKLAENYDNSRRIFEEKLNQTVQETERAKLQIRELLDKIEVLLKAKESLEQTLNEQVEQVAYWRDKQTAVNEKLTSLERNYESERGLKAAVQMKQRELEDEQRKLVQELESKDQEMRKLGVQNQELIREIAELHAGRENLEKNLQSAAKQLEIRERELENTRRQIREMNAHVEQREMIQKKTQLANQLTEKEVLLKKLIKDQEKIEAEIREREGLMSKILNEQEGLEKEISEAKQTQRHLAEQAKKERPTRSPLNHESK